MNDIFEVKIKPVWENIEIIRNSADEFLKSKGCNDVIRDAIIMTISELVENAVKYGCFTDKCPDIYASVTPAERIITVEVKSPVREQDDMHFKRLDRIVQWVRGFQNPFEAYIAKIKDIALQPLNDNMSGLGIVRIAYEGQSVIDFYVNDDNVISVSAVYHLSRRRKD
ncbi:MAG: ATP-binding protein [Spirochaetota bacterium]